MSASDPGLEALQSRLRATWVAGDFSEVAKSSAARAGAVVTGLDIAPDLLEQGRVRAASEGVGIQFDEGDAEALPYGDAALGEAGQAAARRDLEQLRAGHNRAGDGTTHVESEYLEVSAARG